jgi:hypothetical protein
MSVRHPRLSGSIAKGDPLHYVLHNAGDKDPSELARTSGRIPAPHYVKLSGDRKIPQWQRTRTSRVVGYHPAADCSGYFMSAKFQPNNNCYNYACNVATNTFAIPGRRHKHSLKPRHRTLTAEDVLEAVQLDGLIVLGRDSMTLPQALRALKREQKQGRLLDGHMAALVFSPAHSESSWQGDFHFVRCDHPSGRCWSQKDGPDQVTNFDFAGHPITNPAEACWTVNQGPRRQRRYQRLSTTYAQRCVYEFAAWLFVPFGKVDII